MISPDVIVPWLLTLSLKSSLLLAAAFVAAALLPRASAASRHVVWLAAFIGVLALPVAGAVLPALRVPVLAPLADLIAPRSAPTVPPIADAPVGGVVTGVITAKTFTAGGGPGAVSVVRLGGRKVAYVISDAATPITAAAPAGAAPAPSVWPMRVFLLWLFGFIMVAVAFAVGVLRTHVVACTALPATGDALSDEVEVLSASLGIVRDVKIVTWAGPAMPMTWGALHPVVLLPEDARSWPADRRREVLTHELAHVRRGDWIARLIAALACAIYWFNPLAWIAARRMRSEQELACDDTVLAGGVQPSDYAANLLEVARALRVPSFAMANASVAMARPSQLTGRLLAVLDESRVRVAAAPRRTVGLAALGAVALLATVGAATPAAPAAMDAAVAWTEPGVPDTPPPDAPAPAVAAVATAAAPAAMAGGPDCWDRTTSGAAAGGGRGRGRGNTSVSSSGSRSSSHSSSSGDDGTPNRVTLSLSEGQCTLAVRMIGIVRFTDDESDIASVSRDGSFRITEEGNGPERRLDVAWREGRLERRWRVDGDEVPESPELRAWLAQALQAALSRTGYDVVPRTMRAYRAGGLDSALRLSEATGSDYARRQMLMAVLDSARVPAGEAARIARQALTMSSDYEKAELLITVAQRLRLDGPVQDAMVEAASSMSSDYERRRVLGAALERQELSPQAAQELLRSAASMSSDYEKAELLIAFGQGRSLNQGMQAGFLAATNSMSSDYERRRVLSALVARQEASPTIAEQVCAQSTRFSSDYERAELLTQLARKFGASAEARACIRRATDGMSSDYERDRVLAVLGRIAQ